LTIDRFTARERSLALQLPETVSPRVRTLAEQWLTETDPAQPLQLVARALQHFRQQPFYYTLSPGLTDGDPVDDFLFESRRGFCEHYAGSFTLLMRLAGVPARVVIGYQGGEYNPRADHWIIRQSDAHAWSEVWLPDRGWWRVDPTAAVAPERIEQSIDPGLSEDEPAVVFQLDQRGLLGNLWREAGWLVDAVDLSWHRWIIGFTAERQQGLFELMGIKDLRGLGLAAALLIGGAIAALLAFLISQLPAKSRIDVLPALWQKFRRKLRQAGIDTAGWQGPDTLCRSAIALYPNKAQELIAINRLYVQLRYGRHQDTGQLNALRRRIAGLRLGRPGRAD
jgi:hypothetical protein